MSRRFFIESPLAAGRLASLTGQEAQHLGRVLRAKAGDEVVLFDGRGAEFTAAVRNVARNEVELEVLAQVDVDREASRTIVLAVAMPKGDRQRWLVEKAVELGVQRVIPLSTQRGVAQPTSSAIRRLERAVIEASKQCGRNRLMEIADPWTLDQLLAGADETAFKTIAHPTGDSDIAPADAAICWAAIGPEGGFTDEEVQASLDAGWKAVSFGPRILRVETAAIYVAARWL